MDGNHCVWGDSSSNINIRSLNWSFSPSTALLVVHEVDEERGGEDHGLVLDGDVGDVAVLDDEVVDVRHGLCAESQPPCRGIQRSWICDLRSFRSMFRTVKMVCAEVLSHENYPHRRALLLYKVHWSPLVKSAFCPKKVDLTSGLTYHQGNNSL